jgi:hypothetical protein
VLTEVAVAKELGITDKDQWTKVNKEEIIKRGGFTLLKKHGGSLIKGMKEMKNFLWEKYYRVLT